MYSQLYAEMVRTNQSEVARQVVLAGRRQEVKGARGSVTHSGKERRRAGIVTGILTLIGRTRSRRQQVLQGA